MTKELQNAIRHIKTRSDAWAVKVIEDALEQEPCERFEWGIDGKVYKITKAKDGKEICQQVCNDAISREEAIDQCNQSINVLEATDRIKALSSVQPSRKVIEDIRAEIQYEADNKAAPRDMMGYYRCLQIIDKHISGKENG